MRVGRFTPKFEVSQNFVSADTKQSEIIISGDMRGGNYTSQPANVPLAVRCSRLQAFSF